MGIVFCCFKTKDHPNENPNASNSDNDILIENFPPKVSTNIVTSTYSENPTIPDDDNKLYENIVLPDREDECPTCLEEYNDENPKITTECDHHFHLSCIYDWLEISHNCPICSRVMVFEEAT